jgi:hypothetical protein
MGCSVAALIGVLLLVVAGTVVVAAWLVEEERLAVRYPGAIDISSHANYKGLPFDLRWDDAYRTTDAFPRVYQWYSTVFDLGAEVRALGGCILLEGSEKWLAIERHMSVVLCDTPTERMIFVTRSTSLR